MAEHIDRYDEFATFLVEKGLSLVVMITVAMVKQLKKMGNKDILQNQDGFERVTEDVREVLLQVREDLA